MEFSRQENYNGLPFPTPGNLPDPGIEPASLALAGRFFTTEPPGKPIGMFSRTIKNNSVFVFHQKIGTLPAI